MRSIQHKLRLSTKAKKLHAIRIFIVYIVFISTAEKTPGNDLAPVHTVQVIKIARLSLNCPQNAPQKFPKFLIFTALRNESTPK